MAKWLVLVLCVCFHLSLSAQNNSTGELQDVVYLKNGGVIKETIVEQIPNVSLKVETKDGSIFVLKTEEVEKIVLKREKFIEGQAQNQVLSGTVSEKEQEPGLAFLFSLLLPGGGQYYNGDYEKGIVMTSLAVGSIIGMVATAPTEHSQNSINSSSAFGFFTLVLLSTDIWSIIDAPVRANKINKSRELVNWDINKNMNLSMKPNMQLSTINMRQTTAYGLKVSLSLR